MGKFTTDITRRIRTLRRERELSQREVSERLGWHPETYRQKEVGMLRVDGGELAQIARLYELPIREAFPTWEPTVGELALHEALGAA